MKKIILSVAVLMSIIGGYIFYQSQKNNSQPYQPKVDVGYYKNLEMRCASISHSVQAECCFDSVKTMEVVGGILFPEEKYKENNKSQCPNGLKRMILRCSGSYTWCKTHNDFENDALISIPQNVPQINPNLIMEL